MGEVLRCLHYWFMKGELRAKSLLSPSPPSFAEPTEDGSPPQACGGEEEDTRVLAS